MIPAPFLLPIVFVVMLVEARRAAANERRQRARGGVEPPHDVYRTMQWAYPLSFLAMIVEGTVRGNAPAAAPIAGAMVFAGAKALKWWAIVSLGRAWTFRVIVVPGDRLVGNGPYRVMRHPNYIAVLGELVGVALLTGARLSGPLAVIGFGWLMLRRIAVEERAFVTIGRPGAE